MINYDRDIELKQIAETIQSLDHKVLYILREDVMVNADTYKVVFRPKYNNEYPKKLLDEFKCIRL